MAVAMVQQMAQLPICNHSLLFHTIHQLSNDLKTLLTVQLICFHSSSNIVILCHIIKWVVQEGVLLHNTIYLVRIHKSLHLVVDKFFYKHQINTNNHLVEIQTLLSSNSLLLLLNIQLKIINNNQISLKSKTTSC